MSDAVSFLPSAEQSLLRDSVRKFCAAKQKEARPLLLNGKATQSALDDLGQMSQLGLLGVMLPAEVEGSECTVLEAAIVAEEIGRHLLDIPFLSSAVLACDIVQKLATPAQRRELLLPVVRGEKILALAYDECGVRQDLAETKTMAEVLTDGKVILSGAKTSVLGGHVAQNFIVAARLYASNQNADTVQFFVVPRNAPGLSDTNFRLFDGTMISDLNLDGVEIDLGAMLGPATNIADAVEQTFDQALLVNCAEMMGAMECVTTMTRDYLRTREQYGASLSTFQVLQHRFADMCTSVELSRSALLAGLQAFFSTSDAGRRRDIAAAKIKISESARSVSAAGVQLHGAMGIVEEHLVGRLFRRLAVLSGTLGSSEFHRQRYADLWSSKKGS